MPPVFGPVSPSPIRLKSCAGASGDDGAPIREPEEGHLVALEQLLDHERARKGRGGT